MFLMLTLALAAPDDAESVRDGMSAHWSAAVTARDAVIAGDLAGATAAAETWTASEPAGDSQLLMDARDRLAAPFGTLANAKTLAEAGAALGDVVTQCGACHREARTSRSYEPPKPPMSGTAMQHHRAGAEYMWAGLVSGSGSLFDAGADTLASSNLVRGGLPTGTDAEKTAQALEMQVQDAAARAKRTTESAERARLFGQMIGTCAVCHQVTRGGPDATGGAEVPDGAPLVSEMHQRFAVLLQARDAVRAGNLEAAKGHGEALVALDPPTGLPMEPWRPWVVEVRAHAADLAGANNLYDAGLAVSHVAASCGGCHVAVEGGPAVPTRDALDGTDGADLLWLGLLTESDEAWTLGAELLGERRLQKTPPGDARARAFARFITP